ncbi:hypothetical protein K3495_g13060 [Podosphaera aphanis]|nr:hypothetical protein K3495_g13060 [Podosphaera aphanis]
MTSNAETSSYTQDVHDCLLEDSVLEVFHKKMDNIEFPGIDNDVNQYCGDAHQSDRARLGKFAFVSFSNDIVVLPLIEQDLDDEENFSSLPTPPSSTYNSYLEAEKD